MIWLFLFVSFPRCYEFLEDLSFSVHHASPGPLCLFHWLILSFAGFVLLLCPQTCPFPWCSAFRSWSLVTGLAVSVYIYVVLIGVWLLFPEDVTA